MPTSTIDLLVRRMEPHREAKANLARRSPPSPAKLQGIGLFGFILFYGLGFRLRVRADFRSRVMG